MLKKRNKTIASSMFRFLSLSHHQHFHFDFFFFSRLWCEDKARKRGKKEWKYLGINWLLNRRFCSYLMLFYMWEYQISFSHSMTLLVTMFGLFQATSFFVAVRCRLRNSSFTCFNQSLIPIVEITTHTWKSKFRTFQCDLAILNRIVDLSYEIIIFLR